MRSVEFPPCHEPAGRRWWPDGFGARRAGSCARVGRTSQTWRWWSPTPSAARAPGAHTRACRWSARRIRACSTAQRANGPPARSSPSNPTWRSPPAGPWPASGVRRMLSIVAGVPSPRIEAALGGEPAVVRAMPNTPALVGAGVTAISGGSFATSADLAWAEEILSAVGDGGAPARAPARCGHRAVGVGARPTSSWSPRRSWKPGCRWA